ncbi:MAG: carbohydrate binding domain-containing protein, partial [Polyangiaceae bacterium]
FDAGSEPWQVSFGGSAKGTSSVKDGALCATITNAGENPWDAQLQFASIPAETGRSYVIDYRVWTSKPSDVRAKLGLDAAPWTEYWVQNVAATPQPQRVTYRFVLADKVPGTLGLGFQFAGYFARQVPVTLCIDDVSLTRVPSP